MANVLVMRICGQVPRGGVASIVVAKDEPAVRRHVLIGVLEPDNGWAQLKEFFYDDSSHRRAVFISEGVRYDVRRLENVGSNP